MRIRRARIVILFALAFTSLVMGFVSELEADDLSLQEHIAIAPRSIPVPESGNASFAVTRLRFRNGSNADADTNISRIDFQVTKTGTLSFSDISSVTAYFEPQGGAGIYDNNDPAGDDLNIMDGAAVYDTGTGSGHINFLVSPLPTPQFPSADAADFGWGASTHIFIVLEIASTADTASTVGCHITEVTFGSVGDGTDSTLSPLTVGAHNTQDNLDTYEVNLTATGITTGDKDQASTNVPVLELEFTTLDASAADIDLDAIKLHSLGDDDTDIALAGVLLYEDVDDDDVFEPGGDDGISLASGSLSGGYVTLNPPLDLIFTPTVTRRFFVAVNVALAAAVGNTIELEVENPSTDFTFKDIIYDDNQGILADYSYVPLGYPYTQEGYFTGTTATPTTGNSFNVTELYVPTPPKVSSIVPGDGATGVLRSDDVTAEFSEAMDPDTINSPATNFILFIDNNSNSTYDAGTDTNVPGTVSYDGPSMTATFNPTSDLDWTTTYTATVTTGVMDSNDGLNMTLDKIWVFSTQVAVYPIVSATSPVTDDTDVLPDAVITADFSKDMVAATVEGAFSLEDGASNPILGTAVYSSKTLTFTPSSYLDPATVYTATIDTTAQAIDGLSLQTDKVWSFTTSWQPVVLSGVPGDGAQGVSRFTTITATFSKAMDATTIDSPATNFILFIDNNSNSTYDAGTDTNVPGTVSYDSPTRTATFTPSTALDWDFTYTVTITTAVADADGINPESDTVWTFDTATATNPAVTSVTPLDGTTGVNRMTAIRATFSEDIVPATIESPANNFILFIDNNSNSSYDAGTDTLVPGNVTYDSGTYTATFTPDANLSYSAYIATITTGVEDPDGLALSAAKTWSFSTLPTLNEPVVAGNRIVSGGNQQALIFVTQPPGGPSQRVSVQVFTTSGRRVATLVNNVPFSSISVPVVWDGTNGRGDKLGPGLYFVQIRAGSYKRVLKVMIVR